MKNVYMSGIPSRRWKDSEKECMWERGAARGGRLEQARRECLERKRWKLFCHDHPLGGRSWRERGVTDIEWNSDGLVDDIQPLVINQCSITFWMFFSFLNVKLNLYFTILSQSQKQVDL